jgi:hypothetical protein
MKELSAAGLADLAGVTEPEVARLVELKGFARPVRLLEARRT